MDILTHALCGAAAGTLAAAFVKNKTERAALIAAAAIGAVVPDLDAISLWSKFDGTFGKIFALKHTGKYIYSAKFWYSHHAFMHSIFAGILMAVCAGLAWFSIKNAPKPQASFENIKKFFVSKKIYFAAFLSGYILHLFGDLPTPASTWGGIRMFFPFKAYVGGSGKIWWWNNYDLFLIVCAIIALNSALLLSEKYLKNKTKVLAFAVFMFGFCFTAYRTQTRGFDFNYFGNTSRYQEYELKSKDIQKELLGRKLYKIMETIDGNLPIYF